MAAEDAASADATGGRGRTDRPLGGRRGNSTGWLQRASSQRMRLRGGGRVRGPPPSTRPRDDRSRVRVNAAPPGRRRGVAARTAAEDANEATRRPRRIRRCRGCARRRRACSGGCGRRRRRRPRGQGRGQPAGRAPGGGRPAEAEVTGNDLCGVLRGK